MSIAVKDGFYVKANLELEITTVQFSNTSFRFKTFAFNDSFEKYFERIQAGAK